MRLPALYGIGEGQEVTNTHWTRFMGSVIDVSHDPLALDSSQCFLGDAWDTGTEWRAIYTGATKDATVYAPDGKTYTNVDQCFLAYKTKSNDVRSGWTKYLGVDGTPKPVLQPSTSGFDSQQLWLRSIIREGSILKGWYGAGNGSARYKIGYVTCADLLGEVWTKQGQVYDDSSLGGANQGIVIWKVCHNGTNYVAFYNGISPNTQGFFIATSPDGTNWTKTQSNVLLSEFLGFLGHVYYESGTYYIWIQKDFKTGANLGPAKAMYVYSSTNLTDWTNLGRQVIMHGSQEFGIGNDMHVLQKPDGSYFALCGNAKSNYQAVVGVTFEPSSNIKVFEGPSKIANSSCRYSYPTFVKFYAPLDYESGLTEEIGVTSGTYSGSLAWAQWQYLVLNGSTTLTFANSGSIINGTSLGVRMMVSLTLTGTHTLLKIGNDILVTLETGKLRVRLSNDGSSYQKDYISTADIARPSANGWLDNHTPIGFHWDGTTLKLFNYYAEMTTTKTVDNTLGTVNNSGSSILVQNPTVEIRGISILGGLTADELLTWDI